MATITISNDPEITLGPLTVSWHGLMIAVGVVVGGWMASVFARERGLKRERIVDLVAIVAVAGILGVRLFYLAEHGDLLRPSEWFGAFGFSIYGAVILGPLAAAAYMRWRGLGTSYLDALAAGLPLGLLVGRTGDLINGEHYGPASDLPWAVRNNHPRRPHAEPGARLPLRSLYEMALGLGDAGGDLAASPPLLSPRASVLDRDRAVCSRALRDVLRPQRQRDLRPRA